MTPEAHATLPEAYAALVDAFRDDPGVRLLYAFGSAVRGESGARDLDAAVLLDRRPSWDRERELRAAAASIAPMVDLVILNGASPVLRREVVVDGKCLLARDADERAEFEIQSTSRFLDFQVVRRVQQQYLRARAEQRHGSAT